MATRSYVDIGALQRNDSGVSAVKTSYVDFGVAQRIEAQLTALIVSLLRPFNMGGRR